MVTTQPAPNAANTPDAANPAKHDPRWIHRTCTLCEATCGIRVKTQDNQVLRIESDPEDPFSRGHICPKAHALSELHSDPDRLRTPMRKTENGFVPIGWAEALDLAAEQLIRIREEAGNDAIALYRGNPTTHDAQSLLYWNVIQTAIPTRSQFSAGSVDTWPRWVQAGLMYGGFLNTPVPDIERCETLLIIGANPLASNGSLMTAPGIKKRLQALQARGGQIIVVDPRRTETAELADVHHFIRPGGDTAFLLGLLNVLFEEDRIDLGAATDFARNLGRIREIASEYPPERVAPASGISADAIRDLARDLANANRAAVYGRMGASVQTFGTLAHWAIDLLNIVTGNLDREGGLLFPKPAASLAFAGPSAEEGVKFGRAKTPVSGFDEVFGEWPVAAFAEEIESEREDRIRALVIIAGNPVASAPNSARVAAAMDRLEFVVAFDYYINETTRHADLIFPPTSPLEHDTYDLALMHFAVENVAKWSPAALEPKAEMQPIWQTLLGLGKRMMGLAALSDDQVDALVVGQLIPRVLDRSPFAGKLDPEAISKALGETPGPARLIELLLRLGLYGDGFGQSPDGITLEKVKESRHGIELSRLTPSLPESIQTPDGQIDLAPQRILDDLPRLNAWIAAGPDPRLSLIGRRNIRSMNSWLHNLPSMVKGRDRCTLYVSPVDAARLGLKNGGRAKLRSRIRSIEVPVEVTDEIAPGVVSLPHGWGHDLPGVQLTVAGAKPGVNANLVVDDAPVDMPSGTSVLNGIPVELEPA
ncbi:MAG: molybdopterin-dependent oxidoreductase [Myxococcota bacterium]